MIVDENKMKENQGVLFARAFDGLSFQVLGALGRLARRVLSLEEAPEGPRKGFFPVLHVALTPSTLKEDLDKAQHKFSHFVWVAEEALTANRPLNEKESSELNDWIEAWSTANHPTQLLWVLPLKTQSALVEKIKQKLPQSLTLLTPNCWGLGDSTLMDQALHLLEKKADLLEKPIKEEAFLIEEEWISYGELASQVLVAVQGESFEGRFVRCEGQNFSTEEWRQHFTEVFGVESDWLSRLASKLSSETLSHFLEEPDANPPPNYENSDPVIVFESSRNIFPNPKVSLKRSLEVSARAYKKNPEVKQVFLPGKSL